MLMNFSKLNETLTRLECFRLLARSIKSCVEYLLLDNGVAAELLVTFDLAVWLRNALGLLRSSRSWRVVCLTSSRGMNCMLSISCTSLLMSTIASLKTGMARIISFAICFLSFRNEEYFAFCRHLAEKNIFVIKKRKIFYL